MFLNSVQSTKNTELVIICMCSRNSDPHFSTKYSGQKISYLQKRYLGCREPKCVPYPLKLISNILNTYPCLETLKSYYSHAWKSRFSHHRRILSSNSFFSRQKYLPPPFIFFRGRPQTMLTRICPSLTTYSHFTLVRKHKQTVDISNTTYLPKSPCQRSL